MYRSTVAKVTIYLGFAFIVTICDIFKLIIKLNFQIPEAICDQGGRFTPGYVTGIKGPLKPFENGPNDRRALRR